MERLNLTEFIANSKFNRFQMNLLVIVFFLLLFDGYDIAVFGTIAPVLMAEWSLTPIEVGAIGSYSVFGMLFGAIFFGTMADRVGRKRVILATVLLFSLFTFLCGFADNPTFFSVCRFIAGLGLGGIMPNAIALLTDYSPKRMRSTIVTICLCGYSVGGILAPLLGILVIPTLGWEMVLWVAVVPLVFLPLLYRAIPESTSVLLRKGKREELFGILKKINPDAPVDQHSEVFEETRSAAKLPLTDLFKDNRTLSTVMFWLAFFSLLLLGYGLVNWLPKLMMDAGHNLTSSLTFPIVMQVGAIIGTLVAGRLADKLGAKPILITLYVSAAVVLALLGYNINVFVTYLLVAFAGASVFGAQNLVQVYMSQYYPAYVRSTALGTASSVGRVGGMLGPLLGGLLLSFSFSNQTVFLFFAIPGLFAAIAIAMVQDRRSDNRKQLAEVTTHS